MYLRTNTILFKETCNAAEENINFASILTKLVLMYNRTNENDVILKLFIPKLIMFLVSCLHYVHIFVRLFRLQISLRVLQVDVIIKEIKQSIIQ